MASGGRISDFLSFANLVDVLEKISLADTNDKKKKCLQRYLEFLRKHFQDHHNTLDSEKAGGDSLYFVIRILLPDVDRGRKAYGFKSTALGRMFAQILGLDKNSRDGKSLIEFRNPHRAGSSAGNISNIIFGILKSRFSAKTTESKEAVTISEIHNTLDKLSKGLDADVNQEHQKKTLQTLVRKLTPLEGKWLVRMLLKDMQLGFSSTKTAVYGLLHPQAKSLSERISDLELLCQKVNDPTAAVKDVDIVLFSHFRPMLATRMDIIDSAFESGSLGNSANKDTTKSKSGWGKPDVVTLPAPPFYVETKWDGERFQIHFDKGEFKYFSRRAFDYSQKFNETLTPKLRQQLKPGVTSFILDGEMMAYNLKHKIFTQKGNNIDVKTMNKDNPNHCPVFVAFDILYFNGTVITKMPLKDRREKLKDVFKAKDDVVRLSEVKVMNTKDKVIECLNSAIDDGEEGLIAKDLNSVYEPGKRLVTWLKIKPEYLEDNSVDDLDLVILGAYYTESVRRGGELTHFLVGLVDKSKGRDEYYPVAKVGSGRLRSLAVKDLVEELRPKFVSTPVPNVHLKSRRKPDFMIDPSRSIVVQVKASEIIPSDVYACNYTLRFPRITKIRKDKSPSEIMDVKEFLRIREACGGKLAKRTDGAGGTSRHPFFKQKRHHSDFEDSEEDDLEPQIKKNAISQEDSDVDDDDDELPGPSKTLLSVNRPKISLATTKQQKPTNASPTKLIMCTSKKSNVSIKRNIFNSKLFCVYGTPTWKTEMENKIRQYGGDITQSPDVKNFFAIVGVRRTSVLVQKAIKSGKYDVLLPSWIDKCIEKGEEVATVPLDYWAMKAETRETFKEEYDEYGDSYTKENTLEETKAIIQRMLEDEDLDERAQSNTTPNTSPQKTSSSNQQVNESVESDDGHCSDSGSSTDFSDDDLNERALPNDTAKQDVLDREGSWNFMSEVLLAFRGKVDEGLKVKFEFYGGITAASENEPKITHVVLCKEGNPSKEDHSRAFVVTQQWLEDSLRQKEVLDERRYIVT